MSINQSLTTGGTGPRRGAGEARRRVSNPEPLLAEQALEVEALADLAGVLGHACRGHVTSLRGIWLAGDEAAEEALMQQVREALHGGVAGTEVSRVSVQWLHPWAGMRVEDAGLQRLSAIEASGWWAACGLALRGVDAWSR